ncbi:MAG: NAD(+) diphosphatase [Chloroflexota bacterium]
MHRTFTASITRPSTLITPALWFAFAGDALLCDDTSEEGIPLLTDFTELGLKTIRHQYLGQLDDVHCYSVELDRQTVPPEGMSLKNLRFAYSQLPNDVFAVAGRAVQIVDWDRNHQFCGRCGAETATMPSERGKQCPNCHLVSYPRLSPSIIVLIRRGDEVLLARSPRFPKGMYSVLAGFVEPGETLEDTVHREVKEEVGISVKNLSYFGSQPWPFPNSLMLGFMAEYAGGHLKPDPTEIEDVGWFTVDNLPNIPPKLSIARGLIDAFIESVSEE